MLIGAMNHPQRNPLHELEWFHSIGFDFVDFSLEPPAATPEKLDPREICLALERLDMRIVGHTPFYLPLASGIASLRHAAIDEMRRAIDFFSKVGALWVNVHPDPHRHFASRDEMEQANLEALAELVAHAVERNIGLMIENLPRSFNSVAQLAPLLDPLPELGLHLDIGHAHLGVEESTASELIRHYGPRIRHVHVHDNKGGSEDLHLPLGAGNIDIRNALAELKATGYDGTITLEVFSRDPHYLRYSREVLRTLWDEL